MQNRWIVTLLTLPAALVLLTVVSAPSVAAEQDRQAQEDPQAEQAQRQGWHVRRPNAPPTPRLADGKPNFGSTTPNKGVWDLHQHYESAQILVDPKEGIPYQPWAKALKDYRSITRGSAQDPSGFCVPLGAPRAMMSSAPMEFIHQPELKRIAMIFMGGGHIWRFINMDGSPHPPDAYDLPTWSGHATGRWDVDTLVVDTVGYNEGHWIDRGGNPRTHLLHVTERFTRLDYYTLEHEATVDDPGAYTRPWTIKHLIQFDPEARLTEFICQENNKFLERSIKLDGEK